MRLLLVLLAICQLSQGEDWDSASFPNPTAGDFKKCNMESTANICDPDGMLTPAVRNKLDHDLKQLEARTRQDNQNDFCAKRGVTGAIAVAKKIKGGSTEDAKTMANAMLKNWTLDSQCHKAVVILLSTDDHKFWVARDDKVPVYAKDFNDIFRSQKDLFKKRDFDQALTNVLQKTWETALNRKVVPQQKTHQTSNNASQSSGEGMKWWYWIIVAVILVVIVSLICCCCFFAMCCSCCASGGDNNNQDIGMEQGYNSGGGGGGAAYSSDTVKDEGGGGDWDS